MNEVKNCLKSLAFYYLLLAICIIPEIGIIPRRFPTDGLDSICLLTLSVCLIVRYYQRVTGRKRLKTAMLHLAGMIFLLFLVRAVKYTVVGNISALGRYTWYLYYIPILCIPMLLFYVSLYIYARDEETVYRKGFWLTGVTVLLIALVLTNDLHQLVFRFQPEFVNWDGDYSYGIGFYIVNVWEYGLYLAAVIRLVVKYPVSKIRRWSWLISIPSIIGITMLVLLITGNMVKVNGYTMIEFPETYCFMAACVLECCIQLGLIPVNENYGRILQKTNLQVQITDPVGTPYYKSASSIDLTQEQFQAADGTRIGEHTILHRMALQNSYGFWLDDVAELDHLNEKLEDTKTRLSEETELIRLQNELKEKQKTIEERTVIYNNIVKRTQGQSALIASIAQKALKEENQETRDRYRRQIAMLASYIKRYANLMILSAQSGSVSTGEFGLSVAEVLRYLNLYGIPGDIMNTAEGMITAKQALAMFETFEKLLEEQLSDLQGIYANLTMQKSLLLFKITLENMRQESCGTIREELLAVGIQTSFELEDNVGYFSFLFEKGGDEV